MRKAHHTWLQPSTFLVSLIIKDLIFCPLRSSRCFWWCCLIRGQNLLRTNSLLQWNVTYVTFTWERSIPDDKMPKFVSLHRQYGGCLSTSYLSANMVFLVRCCFVVFLLVSAMCRSVRPASAKDCTSENEARTQSACASVPIRIVSYSYTVIIPCTVLYGHLS